MFVDSNNKIVGGSSNSNSNTNSSESIPLHSNSNSCSIHTLGVKTLVETPLSSSEKKLANLKLGVKILFFPLSLLAHLFFISCSRLAASNGLGSEEQTRNINHDNKKILLDSGGQEIHFGFENKAVLEGMYFQANPNTNPSHAHAKTILLCTGSHLSYENYAIPMVKTLKSLGHNVMIFNYEGFGNSEGAISEKGVYRSVEAAYQYLIQEKNCQDSDITAWGYSLGSGAVSALASKHKIDIVIDRGFSTMSEVAYHQAPNGLKNIARLIFYVGAHFDNTNKLKKVQGNILIAQGQYDTTMVKEKHGFVLQKAISDNTKAIFKEVDSGHMHDRQVWFSKGKDHDAVKQFLTGKES